MANCNTKTYAGATALALATAFIETVDDAKIISVCMTAPADVLHILVVYKT